MRKVLIFTYYWPPSGGPGVQRFLKFCKFLGAAGWEPIVVTVRNGGYPSLDPSLEQEIPEHLVVHKTETFEPFELYNLLRGKKGKSIPVAMMGIKDSSSPFQRLARYVRANFFIPDARKGWVPYAVREARKLLKAEPVEAVITTGPPHSTHLIGRALKQAHGLPWIADFRDPWTTIYYNRFLPRSARSKVKDQALEDAVLREADGVVVVSEGLKQEFADRAANIRVIYNGYDQVDLEGEDAPDAPPHFTLAYIGNLKPNQNPPGLWQALSALVGRDKDFARDFRLKLTGNADPFVLEDIRKAGLADHLEVEGYLPHKEATRAMRQAAMLLFLIPESPKNHLILTGKLFEYLASGTPMLSVGPVEGNAARIVAEAGRDPMSAYADQEAMQEQVLHYYRHWVEAKGQAFRFELSPQVTRFSRQEQARALGQFLDTVTLESSSS
ncbi:MAG: glycosyltransferase [Bacteroidota bacterium]